MSDRLWFQVRKVGRTDGIKNEKDLDIFAILLPPAGKIVVKIKIKSKIQLKVRIITDQLSTLNHRNTDNITIKL